MTLKPTDGNEVSDAEMKALETPPAETEPGSEPSQKTPVNEPPKEPAKPEVPYHEDPAVQLYIERQVAKRMGESGKAYEDRIKRLEDRLTNPNQPVTIGGWRPKTNQETQIAKAIILQAKKEMAEELRQIDTTEREKIEGEDQDFDNWLKELRSTEVLKTEEDEIEFARLIAEYKLEDKQAAINLWTRLQDEIKKAREDGRIQGVKRTQIAKVGNSRKGNEPGRGEQSYQQRRTAEPNFDAILDRELTRLTGQ